MFSTRLPVLLFLMFMLSLVHLETSRAQSDTDSAAGILSEFAEFEPEEEMIFEVRLDNRFVLERSLNGYYRNEKAYLPLGEMCRLLEFPINSNSGNGTAAGWFLAENRRFALDLTNLQVVSGDIREAIAEGEFYRLTDDIYVTHECLTRWFPVQIESRIRELVININPLEKLPIMQRMEREARWSRLRTAEKQALLPLKRSPYELFSSPIADLSLSSNLNKNNSHIIPTRYTINLANDMLFHTTQIYASGNEKDGLSAARLKMSWAEQYDEQKTWLGYNTYSFGDITPTSMPLIPSLRSGRGFYFSNTPLNYSSEFAFTTISGNLPAGWSAELYRGRNLLETISPQQSRDEMYYFENVPILTGNNEFIVKLYGPYGEIREERQNLFVGSGMVAPQKTYYKFSALQNNKEMLPVKKFNSTVRDGYTLRSELTTGITNRLTLKHDFAGVIEDDERHLYSTIEAIGSLPETGSLPVIYGSVGVVSQIDAGNALMLRTRSHFSGWNLSNEFFNFDQNFDFATGRSDTDWRNTLSLSGRFSPGQSLSLKWLRDDFANDQYSDLINIGLSSRIGQTTLLNNFDYKVDKVSNQSNSFYSEGNSEVRTRVGKRGELTAGLNYLLKPVVEMRTVGIGGRWQGDDDSSYSAQIRRNLNSQLHGKTGTSFNFGFMKKFTEFSSGLQITGDTYGDLRAMLTISSSFGLIPDSGQIAFSSDSMVRTGGVVVKVLQRIKDGTVPLKDVVVIAGGRRGITDASGTAIIVGLTPSLQIDVAVEPVSLVDPFLVTETPGVSIVPRQGVFQQLTYYVVMTSEIEGKVFFEDEEKTRAVGGIQLRIMEAVSGNITGRARTDNQGFYILDFIRPGSYYVDIDPQQGENLGVYVANRKLVKISDNGDVITDHDVILHDISKRPPEREIASEIIKQLDIAPPIIPLAGGSVDIGIPEVAPDLLRQLNIAPPVIAFDAVVAIPELAVLDSGVLAPFNTAPPLVGSVSANIQPIESNSERKAGRVTVSLPASTALPINSSVADQFIGKVFGESEIIKQLNTAPPSVMPAAKKLQPFRELNDTEKLKQLQRLNIVPPFMPPVESEAKSAEDKHNPEKTGQRKANTAASEIELPAAVKALNELNKLRQLNVAPPLLVPIIANPEKVKANDDSATSSLDIAPPALKKLR